MTHHQSQQIMSVARNLSWRGTPGSQNSRPKAKSGEVFSGTNRRTSNRRHDDANSQSYYVAARSAKNSGHDDIVVTGVLSCFIKGWRLMLLRIYVDAVINHMTGAGTGASFGSAGSWYNSWDKLFAGVPYGPDDFNCCECPERCPTASCNIESYSNAQQVITFW